MALFVLAWAAERGLDYYRNCSAELCVCGFGGREVPADTLGAIKHLLCFTPERAVFCY